MASRPRVHAPIGQVVTTPDGRRLGRVIAIIHHGAGADVLVEDRRWLRHRSLRISGDQLSRGPEHTLVCHAAPIAGGGDAGSLRESTAARRAQQGG
ncbi:MAG: hypothetical protein E6J14_06445 [Chloroflexi bacterium]|nr:MAG: hypothetical protein E6J14_06445 [Chloroflexota bacterium]